MENLIEIWRGNLQAKLREMTVKWCPKLSNILFPSNSIKGMQNLEVLEVEFVYSEEFEPEVVVESRVAHQKDNSVVKMGLEEAHKEFMMESIIGNEPNADDAGSLLKTLHIINCPQMKILPSAFQRKLEQQRQTFQPHLNSISWMESFIFRDPYFAGIGKLSITDINGSIEMWYNQLEVDRLDKVIHVGPILWEIIKCDLVEFNTKTTISTTAEVWNLKIFRVSCVLEFQNPKFISPNCVWIFAPSIEVMTWKRSNIYHLLWCIANLFIEKLHS
ncbi:unnamed protein product [Camellia sinensis]